MIGTEFGIAADQDLMWQKQADSLSYARKILFEDPFILGNVTHWRQPEEFSPLKLIMPTNRTLQVVAGIHGFSQQEFIESIAGKTVLEVGGAKSFLQTTANQLGLSSTIFNLDLTSAFCRIPGEKNSIKHIPNEHEVIASGEAIPFNSESVDVMLATYSLPFSGHSADQMENFFNETLRVLKVLGWASISPVVAGDSPGEINKNFSRLRLTGILRSLNYLSSARLEFGSGLEPFEDGFKTTEFLRITKLASISSDD
jgi:hypothetical protein